MQLAEKWASNMLRVDKQKKENTYYILFALQYLTRNQSDISTEAA
jgi:hypothetical protein